jgi:mono/diheme cytochrome c family protein
MRWQTLLSAVASLSLLACEGALDPIGPGNPAGPDAGNIDDEETEGVARQLYDDNVHQIMLFTCAACHAGPLIEPLKFLGTTPAGQDSEDLFYTALINEPSVTGGFQPSLSNLLNYGEHDGGAARALFDDEKVVITEWLLAEAEERQGESLEPDPQEPDPIGPTNSRQMMAQFSACMTLDNWNASEVYRWANKGSAQGTCSSCHSYGAGGFYANNDPNEMFEMTRYEIFLSGLFTVRVNPDETMDMLVNEQKLRNKSNVVGHPTYNLGANDADLLRTIDFFERTMQRWNDGLCPPAGFPTPP